MADLPIVQVDPLSLWRARFQCLASANTACRLGRTRAVTPRTTVQKASRMAEGTSLQPGGAPTLVRPVGHRLDDFLGLDLERLPFI